MSTRVPENSGVVPGRSRRAFLTGALGVAGAAVLTGAAPASLPRRPNIVVILADDLGWGEVGAYGQRIVRTPNLDRLAAEGVKFTSAYSGAPLCAPSRCALLTGLHSGHATVRENPEGGPQHALTSADLTFAELLQLSGYRTACIGKWGFGPQEPGQPSHPNQRGIDEFFGYIDHQHAHQYWPHYLWHNDNTVALDGKTYAPDLLLEKAVSFIEKSAGSPFLLYFPTILPHAPSAIPADGDLYRNAPWTQANRGHAGQVTRLDAHVGALISALRRAGVADRTVVLFAGDNGPHSEKGVNPEIFNSNGPYRGDKRELYEGGIRVPMIAWSPRLPHRVIRRPVAFWDVLPTLADLADLPVPANLDGLSFGGLLTGAPAPTHDYLLWNRPRKAQAVRRGRWKLIRFAPGIAGAGPGGRLELYEIPADPGERHNRAAERPDLVAELLRLMDRSIGPDPRRPYGLRVAHAGNVAQVTLVNGSADPWRKVRLGLVTEWDRRAIGGGELERLDPGASFSAAFTVLPAVRGSVIRVTATAMFAGATFVKPYLMELRPSGD